MEDRFSIPIIPPECPHIEVDPSLRTISQGVHIEEAIDAPVPDVRATAEERFNDFDLGAVTHVLIQQVASSHHSRSGLLTRRGRVTVARQTQLFRHVGYQYDWGYPGPFWHSLGRMAAKGLFDGPAELKEF